MRSKLLIGILSTTLLTSLNADLKYDSLDTIDLSETVAKVKYSKNERKLKKNPLRKTSTPYWLPCSALEKNKSVFFQSNAGIGFLYYRKIEGDFVDIPDNANQSRPTPFKRGLSYNRTLLKDVQWGYRFFDWLKVALTYQNQSGLFLYTEPLPSPPGGVSDQIYFQQTAYFSLNALQLKAYLEFPFALVYKKWAVTPYGGIGLGPGWQTWYPVKNRNFSARNDLGNNAPLTFNSKIIPNLTFVLDKGFRVQPAQINPAFSTLLGLKFMYWGQARNLCQLEKQGSLKVANFKPFKIKTIYSFAPYLGLQWNFPASRYDYNKHKKIYAFEFDSLFIHQKHTTRSPFIFSQFNVGPNFLYFSGLKGNLSIKPNDATFTQSFLGGESIPVKQKFKYNRVPLYEYQIGRRLSKTFQLSLSLQTSSYNILQTPYIDMVKGPLGTIKTQFKSYLNLYALMAKGYAYFPYAFRAGFVSMNYYCALGFGPSWQSWYAMETNTAGVLEGDPEGFLEFKFHPKIIVNPSLLIDMGFDMKNAHPDALFHIYAGIRFNLWGQVRNLGDARQQPYDSGGFVSPIRVKTLFSWTPYLSFQWDFPIHSQTGYLDKQQTNTWKPFLVKASEYTSPMGWFFQSNIGPQFLRFSGVQGNYSFDAQDLGDLQVFLSAPHRGRFSINNSLLYEFLLGYKINYWSKIALSLQSATGIYILSKRISEFDANVLAGGDLLKINSQFSSQVQMYSIMLKPYLETPQSVIFKNWAWSAYLGVGLGGSWQSWNNNTSTRQTLLNEDNIASITFRSPNPLRSKASPNVAFMIDVGFRTKNVSPKFNGCMVMGIKYNQWGQILNIGKLTQQWPNYRFGLKRPLQIKTVFSWAPYLGFQWDF